MWEGQCLLRLHGPPEALWVQLDLGFPAARSQASAPSPDPWATAHSPRLLHPLGCVWPDLQEFLGTRHLTVPLST